jgi:hypothetical protein
MIITHEMGTVLIYLGLIIFSPFIACFFWYASRYFLDLYVADEVLIVTYLENGTPVSEIKISSMANGNIVQKISASKDARHE